MRNFSFSWIIAVIFSVIFVSFAPQAYAANDTKMAATSQLLFTGTREERRAALDPIEQRGNPDMLATLILAIRFGVFDATELDNAARKITGDDSRGWFEWIFGSSGFLYRSNKLMFDRQTDSLWNQFTGKPVSGPLVDSGITLAQRPVVITSWGDWMAENPGTKVLDLDTGYRRDYGSGVVYHAYFASPYLMFPAAVDQSRLLQKDYVFGIRQPLNSKAWPIKAFKEGQVINDKIGGKNLVLIGNEATRSVRAYMREDQEFKMVGDSLKNLQDDKGGACQLTEDALIGQGGRRAERVAGHISYWFAWDG
jgi:uncharacterized protein DUF3179